MESLKERVEMATEVETVIHYSRRLGLRVQTLLNLRASPGGELTVSISIDGDWRRRFHTHARVDPFYKHNHGL
ncbi:hypothetical protein RRG08_046435 [Elysia crispata]|uniref:Uncharacterized protein n=1 Tax=Elysia crispata TaxID=231223 RepID=A0AAE0XPS1_9GAST|nr:hypothetical protein RRG08_046435 [Elysia crispata]